MESEASFRTSPKLVEFFDKHQRVTRVTCGGEHTIAVSSSVPIVANKGAAGK